MAKQTFGISLDMLIVANSVQDAAHIAERAAQVLRAQFAGDLEKRYGDDGVDVNYEDIATFDDDGEV